MVNHGQNLSESSSSNQAIKSVLVSHGTLSKKGYLPLWTQEIFTVTKIVPRVPPVYWLQDYADN